MVSRGRAVDLGALGRRQRADQGAELVGLAAEPHREAEIDARWRDHRGGAITQIGTAKRRGASAAITPFQFGESGALVGVGIAQEAWRRRRGPR